MYDVQFEVGGVHLCSESAKEEEEEGRDRGEQPRGEQTKVGDLE